MIDTFWVLKGFSNHRFSDYQLSIVNSIEHAQRNGTRIEFPWYFSKFSLFQLSFFVKSININEGKQEMSWNDWKFNQICFLGLNYHYFYSMSMGHPESYITEKFCLMNSLARLLLFLVYDNHFWPRNTVRISFFIKFKKITMNLHQYCNKQNPPPVVHHKKGFSVSS